MRRPGRYSGELLMATGGLHTGLGLWWGRRTLRSIWRDGIFNAIDPDPHQQSVYWFLASGAGMITTGYMTRWAYRKTGTLPAALGWMMLGSSAVGLAPMPINGLWLVIPQALLIIAEARGRHDVADASGGTTVAT